MRGSRERPLRRRLLIAWGKWGVVSSVLLVLRRTNRPSQDKAIVILGLSAVMAEVTIWTVWVITGRGPGRPHTPRDAALPKEPLRPTRLTHQPRTTGHFASVHPSGHEHRDRRNSEPRRSPLSPSRAGSTRPANNLESRTPAPSLLDPGWRQRPALTTTHKPGTAFALTLRLGNYNRRLDVSHTTGHRCP